MAYVYKHIRLDTNEIFYIGIGKTKRRITDRNNRNDRWTKVVNKAGFIAEIIEDGLDWQTASKKEMELIKFYGRADLGNGNLVNMTNGGDGFVGNHTDATKQKLKEIFSSPDIRKKLRDQKLGKSTGRFGELNPQFGIPMTDKQKQKIRDSKRGIPQSEQHKKNRLESLKNGIAKKKNLI